MRPFEGEGADVANPVTWSLQDINFTTYQYEKHDMPETAQELVQVRQPVNIR